METTSTTTLCKLSDSNMKLANESDDIRGRKVVDIDGEDVGKVDDLFIDDHDKRVRFIQIASGGFLGMGETKFLIPVDAIRRIDSETVHIDRSRQHVAEAPRYDPAIVDQSYYENVYNYYGYTPYWAPGYTYPQSPYF